MVKISSDGIYRLKIISAEASILIGEIVYAVIMREVLQSQLVG
jgi:hypothetical protein